MDVESKLLLADDEIDDLGLGVAGMRSVLIVKGPRTCKLTAHPPQLQLGYGQS